MKEEVRRFLLENSDEAYREFSMSLIPGEDAMVGVRLPVLRKKAKELAKGNWRETLMEEDVYFEEVMLRGMVLSYAKESFTVMLPYIEGYIPCVKNWSVCDSVFSGMKVLREDQERTWEFIQPYLYSQKEFEVRTAVIIMMQHMLKCDETGKNLKRLTCISGKDCMAEKEYGKKEDCGKYLPRILEALNREFPQYYASMAAAWTVAEAFCTYPAAVYKFLADNRLDDDTYDRALQKIVESRIPLPEVKEMIRGMKRKDKKQGKSERCRK